MSYRYVNQPEGAMQQILASLSRRITVLERRSRWPGATQFAENLTDVYYNDNVWTDVVSVTLDPGKWLIYGAAILNSGAYGKLHQLRIPSASSVPSGTTSLFGGFGTGSTTLSVVGTIDLTTRTAVTLQSWSTDTSNTSWTSSAFIIAVPT